MRQVTAGGTDCRVSAGIVVPAGSRISHYCVRGGRQASAPYRTGELALDYVRRFRSCLQKFGCEQIEPS